MTWLAYCWQSAICPSRGCRTLALRTLLTVGNLQFALKCLAHKVEFVKKVCRLLDFTPHLRILQAFCRCRRVHKGGVPQIVAAEADKIDKPAPSAGIQGKIAVIQT